MSCFIGAMRAPACPEHPHVACTPSGFLRGLLMWLAEIVARLTECQPPTVQLRVGLAIKHYQGTHRET